MIIQKINQNEEDFWKLMGPFFASAKVKRDLGVAMSSDESYTWLLVMEKGQVAGFCAIVPIKAGSFPFTGAGSDFRYFYVPPESANRQRISDKLMKEALKTVKDQNLKAVILPDEKPFWESFGFVEVFRRGKYPTMARLVED
jgi:predicted N-acetyltransferase YhbS